MNDSRWALVFAIGAAGNLAIGLWMLVDPVGWYHSFPGVPGSGPLNEHFVRDIGATFSTLGVALAWGAVRPALRFPLLAVVTLFNTAHAAIHVLDTARGLFPPDQWAIDAGPVYGTTAFLIVLLVLLARQAPEEP